MNPKKTIASLGFGALLAVASTHTNAQVITQWTFDNQLSGTNLTPTPSTGTGTASTLGMVNAYSAGNTSDVSDLTGAVGTDTTTGFVNTGASNQEWRVRGTNGWNSAAPIGTQGAQFLTSTAGETNIKITFDLDISTQGEANVEVLYTTNGTTWTNAALTYSGANGSVLTNSTSGNGLVIGSYLHTSMASPSSNSNWFNQISADLSGVSDASNDSNFGFEIVNAATGSADVALKTSQGQINNTSGNWRYDDVTISGVAAAPEPSSWTLAAIVALAFVGLRRVTRRTV